MKGLKAIYHNYPIDIIVAEDISNPLHFELRTNQLKILYMHTLKGQGIE